MRTRAQARRGLLIYLGLLVVLSATIETWIIRHGGLPGEGGRLVLLLMYVPLLSSVVARLAGREGFGDVSFKWGGRTGTSASLAAWLLPVAIGLVVYGIAWGVGLVGFEAPADGRLGSIANPVVRFFAMLPLAMTVGTVLSSVSAFGEEVGWRGYLVPRLVEAQVPAPYLTSALIWCFWHVPLILWGGYAVGPYPMLSALLFIGAITPVGLLYARWRMASGSVWPSVIAHGAWNVVIQAVFDRFSTGERAPLWVGESGILTVATLWVVYFLARNARWAGTIAPKAAT